MSKRRRKSSKRWLTREFFISSTLIILVISGVVFGAWLLLRPKDPNHMVVEEQWLSDNIWRVQSYKPLRNGKYDIYLLDVETAYDQDFDALRRTFNSTPYTSYNSYWLLDGVNCQGMTVYIADWCERNLFEYSVAWTRTHTWIYVSYDNVWYKFDFDMDDSSIEEVMAKDVEKGMIVQ